MRRALTATVLATTLLLGAACSDSRDDVRSGAGGTPTPAGPSATVTTPGGAPGAVTAPAGGNAKEVCAAATKVSAESATTYVTELAAMLEATAEGNGQAAQAAQKKAEAALDRWAAEMRAQADKATDPHLRAVLTEIAVEVDRMEASIETVDEAKLDELQRRLDQLCAG